MVDGTLSRRLGAAMMALAITAAAAGCAGGARNRTNVTTPGGTAAPNVGASLAPNTTGAGMAGGGGGGAAGPGAASSAAGLGSGIGNRVIRSYGEMDLGRQISRYVASLDVVSGGGMIGAGPAAAGASAAGGGGAAAGAGTAAGAGMTGAGMTGTGATNAPGGYTAGGGGGMAIAGPTGAGAADAANAGAGPGTAGALGAPAAGGGGAGPGGTAGAGRAAGAGGGATGAAGAGGGRTSVVTLPRQVGVSTLVMGDIAFIGVTLPAQTTSRLGGPVGVSPAGDQRGSGGPGLEGYLRQNVLTEFPQLSQVFVTTNPTMVRRLARVTSDTHDNVAAHQLVGEMADIARTLSGPPAVVPRPGGTNR